MWFSGLARCCGHTLPRQVDTETVQLPWGPDDWAITAPVLTGTATCRACGLVYLYSLKPTADELRTVPVLDIRQQTPPPAARPAQLRLLFD